ncbi:ubiquinone/menaquinone biosynthesis methyltransferase [Chryseobacterium nakagawai]|uniref:Methyltransferase domain-containing protein n=1 Tax=Chryseobacterium nakagawai TaxID=1241982 RepID=A0AAD0YL43_CHRNA|nr:class I SAM-dependent methyltransferase [Chryseobacterium nakagawai]AZA90448.1 methyltransferase domain-containing protein [Chryseobacterium nakagawai]VEH21947.1 ubiquinone/menaquinone biosynthesis methyltransferase [Chryseobacterium nakagawai]
MRLVTLEDTRDIFIKFHQRGLPFLFSKLKIDSYQRTKSAFNEKEIETSNFWCIPEVRLRWNQLVTGDPNTTYEEYLSRNYFRDSAEVKVLALGSGVCSHELLLAELNPHWQIDCFDFSDKLLSTANDIAKDKNLHNISFYAENIMTYDFEPGKYDMVFFHASLHHFEHIFQFLKDVVIKSLKPTGHLVINEFVGKSRLQYSKEQIHYINKALEIIPKQYRKIYKTNLYKNHYYGSGVLRMIIADPSECVDSESIIPAIHKYFDIVDEKAVGNNLLQSVFKDIAHHFVGNEMPDSEKQKILQEIFQLEDEFLKSNLSDFVFGVYQLKENNID